jgi:hypothetical protein
MGVVWVKFYNIYYINIAGTVLEIPTSVSTIQ